jgi:hypothetical protein
MRLRRHGDTSIVKKTGRKKDLQSLNRVVEQFFKEFSPRTQALYVRGWKQCKKIESIFGLDDGLLLQKLISKHTRSNETFSVAGFSDDADLLAAQLAMEIFDQQNKGAWDATSSAVVEKIKFIICDE